MEENVINGKAFVNAQGKKKLQKRSPAGRNRVTQRALMTACAIVGTVFLIGAAAAPLGAQSYPTRPLRLILPNPPGGATDILGRIIGQKLSERLGQPVVPENRPGAAGKIGIEIVAKARPDGYTLLLSGQTLAVSPGLYKKLNFDPVKDFAPISLVGEVPNLLLIRPTLPIKTLKEFVEYARANPGKLNFGSGGIGHSSHLTCELLNYLAKIKVLNVPYKGVNQAMMGMMGGEVDMVVIGVSAAMPQVLAGKVRPLAVLSDQRLPSLPNVPTSKEAGMDNFEVTSWYGLLAPAGTPRAIVNRLNAEWIKSVATPDTKEQLQSAGVEPLSGTPDQFAEFHRAEVLRWTRIIREANISLD